MLRIHLLQQWFNLSDPAVEEALYDTPVFASFARLDPGISTMPEESTILRFRRPLETRQLGLQILALVNVLLTDKTMRKGLRKKLDLGTQLGMLKEKYEQTKASMRAKVEHPFPIFKQQFGFSKVRYRGIAKNDNKLQTMFALAKLC
jgi:IS5 family transposase